MTDQTIALTTKPQINMWVLLSRRHQIQLHLKGLTVKGLVAGLKREFPEANGRTAKDFIVPVEYAIQEAGGDIDYRYVNVHVMEIVNPGVFQDLGIYPSMAEVEGSPYFVELYTNKRLEIVLTLDEPRKPTGDLFIPA